MSFEDSHYGRTIVVKPYVDPVAMGYRFLTSWPNKHWFAMSFVCRVWDLHFTGSVTSSWVSPLDPDANGSKEGTFDFYRRLEFSGANEKIFGKVGPPTPTDIQPNAVLYSIGETPLDGTNAGTWTGTYNEPGFPDTFPEGHYDSVGGQLEINAYDDGSGLPDPTIPGYGGDETGFGCNFILIFSIFEVSTGTDPNPVPQPAIVVSTNPADGAECGKLTIRIPNWESPATLINFDIPLYGNFNQVSGVPGPDQSSSGSLDILMVPYGATDNPTPVGSPMTDADIVFQHAFDVPLGTPESPADDSRIWNNDLTPHRNPITRVLV